MAYSWNSAYTSGALILGAAILISFPFQGYCLGTAKCRWVLEISMYPLSPSHEWRSSFADALGLRNSEKVHAAVIRAQRDILNRYLELATASEPEPGEPADLINAIDVLAALKRQTVRSDSSQSSNVPSHLK